MSAIIKAVAPPGAATKWVETQLDCSPRQAKRIVSEGILPARFRDVLIAALERANEWNREKLGRIEDDLRAIRYSRMVDRAEARGAPLAGQADRTGAGPAQGNEQLALIPPAGDGR